MIQPNDVNKVAPEDWEEFKKRAAQDELYYAGPGDLLDTAEGRSKFCRLNESGSSLIYCRMESLSSVLIIVFC